jgi:hypothetical protein
LSLARLRTERIWPPLCASAPLALTPPLQGRAKGRPWGRLKHDAQGRSDLVACGSMGGCGVSELSQLVRSLNAGGEVSVCRMSILTWMGTPCLYLAVVRLSAALCGWFNDNPTVVDSRELTHNLACFEILFFRHRRGLREWHVPRVRGYRKMDDRNEWYHRVQGLLRDPLEDKHGQDAQ